MFSSGSYTIQSVSLKKDAGLATNNPNAPVELVDSSGADNETWVAKVYPDGTFTLCNKQWADNAYAGVSNVSSGQQVKAVSASGATRWETSGSQIVISGFAWQATSDGKIVLKPADTADPNQSFNLNSGSFDRVNSGSYIVRSAPLQRVARLATNNLNAAFELVDPSGADNETWVATAYADGTFTLRNKQWADNAYAGVGNISSGQQVQAVPASDATRWKKYGSQIVISGFAWQATCYCRIVLKPADTADSNQSFNLNFA